MGDAVHDIRDETEHLTALVARPADAGAHATRARSSWRRCSVDLADVAEGAVTVLTPLAAEKDVRAALRPGARADDRRSAAAPATGHDPGRQRDRAQPDGLDGDRERRPPRRGRAADGRRRGARHPRRRPAARIRPLLAGRGSAEWRNGPRAGHRALGDRAARRHDRAANLPAGGARFDVRLPPDPSAPGAATRRMLGPSRRPAPPTT